MLALKKALKRRVVAQKRIHHKPRAEAEAGDEGIQLVFTHELVLSVAESEVDLAGQALGEQGKPG